MTVGNEDHTENQIIIQKHISRRLIQKNTINTTGRK
jgi:hypothetical protein